jgi:hypothetical protein
LPEATGIAIDISDVSGTVEISLIVSIIPAR